MDIKKYMKEPVLLSKNATFKEALEAMRKKHNNSVIVVDSDGKMIGGVDIVTLAKAITPAYLKGEDRDIVKSTLLFSTDNLFHENLAKAKDLQIGDFMMTYTKFVEEDTTAMEAIIIVTEGRQSKIPVIDKEGNPIGILTRRGIREMIADGLTELK